MELCTLVIAQSFSTGLLRKQMTKTRILVIRKMITTSPPQETSLNILFQTFSFGVLQAREIGTDRFLCASISIRKCKAAYNYDHDGSYRLSSPNHLLILSLGYRNYRTKNDG